MRIGPWRFSPRPVPTVAAAVMLALFLSLGRWQVMRAGEKLERQALFEARMRSPVVEIQGPVADADALLYRRVRVAGRYLAEAQVFIDNRIHEGSAGFHVVTPLQVEGSRAVVLVNRGWIARNPDYPRAPPAAVPQGLVTVTGTATRPPARVLELSAQTITGNVWQNLSIARLRERTRLDLQDFVVLAAAPAAGLAAVEEVPDTGVARHQEYALTWFSLAATVVALWVGLNLRRA